MQRVIEWLLKNKLKTAIIILIIFLIPLFAANIIFSIPAFNEFLVAKWGPGDFLNYYGVFLSFFGTISLGALALYQNDQLSKTNRDLTQNQYKPIITVSRFVDETKEKEEERTFYRSIQRNHENILINSGWSFEPTYSPYVKLSILNIGLGPAVNIHIFWYELNNVEGIFSLNEIKDSSIEAFYDKLTYSNFTYIDVGETKSEPWLIYTTFDLGISEDTNKLNLFFSFEENAAPFHSIIEITYDNLKGKHFMKKLYLGYDEDGASMFPVSKEYEIR